MSKSHEIQGAIHSMGETTEYGANGFTKREFVIKLSGEGENPTYPNYIALELIKDKYGNQIKVVVAPGPSEIDDAKNINAVSILDKGKALDISQLASLIKESSFVIANDTGPAHMTAHLGVKGLTLFGKHTTAFKVSIERENFKAIQVDDLEKLSASKVLEKILI